MAYKFVEEDSEDSLPISALKSGVRNIARQGTNLATRGIGLPGDILSIANDYVAGPIASAITGESSIPYDQTPVGMLIPTTQQHRKNIEPYTGEYLKPKNKIEQFVDDVVEDAALVFTPGGAGAKAIKTALPGGSVTKAFTKSIGSNLLGETVEQVGDSPTAGAATKAGSLFLLSLLDTKSAATQVSKIYEKAEKLLPTGVTTNASKLNRSLTSLENSVTQGRPYNNLSAPEKFVVDQIEKVDNLIFSGKISVEQAIAQKKSLNKELESLFQTVPNKATQSGVKNRAKQITGYLNETINEYGKGNPEFLKEYTAANEAFGTILKSNFLGSWVEKNAPKVVTSSGLLSLFGAKAAAAAGGAALTFGPAGAASVATAAGGYQAGKLVYRIYKSPALRKIYAQSLASAARQDAPAFAKYVAQLDEAMQEEESKDKWQFVD